MEIKGKESLIKFINKIFLDYTWYFGIITGFAIIVSLQHYFYTPPAGSIDATYHYTHYNNFLIFRQSFFHLIGHKELYTVYPSEFYYDLFKYSPTFALLMAPWAYLPNLAGLILWNVLNAVILFYAIQKFPFSSDKRKIFAIAFIFVEALTSFMISESNCLMTGLLIFAYLAMEKRKTGLAAFLIILSAFIKPFGLAALPLFLFYPGKWKSARYSFLWFLLLFALPLLVISPNELMGLYKSWGGMLKNDHDSSYGLSVMAILHSWFGIEAKYYALLAGIMLFMLPLLRYKSYGNVSYRQMFLAFLLIWVVIFNHKAESPGYVIAVSGVALWFSQSYSNTNLALVIICILFTILSPTDLYPRFVREHFFMPYSIKAVPCILIWIKIWIELMTKDFSIQKTTIFAGEI